MSLPQPDLGVLRKAQKGDERAFCLIFRAYEQPVYNYVLRLVGDRSLAEDLTQEVFLRVYQGLPGFSLRSRFTTWLFQVTKNRVLDELRALERRPRAVVNLDDVPPLEVVDAPFERAETIDAVLLTHEHHDDNLDPSGRELLPSAGVVVTTVSGATRLDGNARGVEPWATTRLEAPGLPAIELTATPCRHGPPFSRALAGDVIGFALQWAGQEHGVLWISGDTVLYDGVRKVADRLRVDTALLHLGGVRFPITGPIRYTMTARDAVELIGLLRPRAAIPVHYEGWKHFQEGRRAIEEEFDRASDDVRSRIRWLPPGVEVELAA